MDDSTLSLKGDSSIAVHAGEPNTYGYDAITMPIVQTSTYTFKNTAELVDYHEGVIDRQEYGRYGNPTASIAERKIALLEGGSDQDYEALLSASGMNAVTMTLLTLLPTNSHVILTSDCYRRTRKFVTTILVQLGITHTIVEPCDYEGIESAIRPETRIIISESPTNPYLRVLDIPRLTALAHKHNLLTIIDATFATPYNIRPLELGIDLVIHSATKYLAGHNDLLAGVTIGKPDLIAELRDMQGTTGGICDPHSAYLLIRGLKTFALRMERHNANGMAVATFLNEHPRVAQAYYPGLPNHPDYAIATAQMRGYGGVISFEINGDINDTSRILDRMKLPQIAPSLGGVESMAIQPSLMSFYELSTEERLAVGIRDNLIRYACGIEDADDIIADLSQALDG